MEEKQNTENTETLATQLAEANERIAQMSGELDELHVEQRLARKLVALGITDLEAGLLIAKARMEGKGDAHLDECVGQMKKEKSYLFGAPAPVLTSRKTAGVKDRTASSQTSLEQAARQAAKTGRRTDLQHYLKLRRNLL